MTSAAAPIAGQNLFPRIALTLCLLSALSAPAQSPQSPSPDTAPPQSPPPTNSIPSLPPPGIPRPAQPRFVIVLDPAHGGSDTGAHLAQDSNGSTLDEKDLTLALSLRLQALLSASGIPVIATRASSLGSPTSVDRASTANHALAAACISLHATATGNGVHLFTSSLAPAAAARARNRFIPLETAQAAFIPASLRLSSEISTALAHAEIPVLSGRTSMNPLDSFNCPAVVIEVAPLKIKSSESAAPANLSDPAYQQKIAEAISAALAAWRNDWRVQP